MISLLRPTYIAHGIEALTPEVIERHEIELVGYDVDGCLSDRNASRIERAVEEVLEKNAEAGCKSAIISNAYDERVEEVNELYGRFVNLVVTPAMLAVDGELPSLYRKPSPAMLQFVMTQLGVHPSRTLMVGDQMFKDVVSANRAGARSLLLPRRGKGDHPGVRLQRIPEAAVRGVLGLPVLSSRFYNDTTGIEPQPRYAL